MAYPVFRSHKSYIYFDIFIIEFQCRNQNWPRLASAKSGLSDHVYLWERSDEIWTTTYEEARGGRAFLPNFRSDARRGLPSAHWQSCLEFWLVLSKNASCVDHLLHADDVAETSVCPSNEQLLHVHVFQTAVRAATRNDLVEQPTQVLSSREAQQMTQSLRDFLFTKGLPLSYVEHLHALNKKRCAQAPPEAIKELTGWLFHKQ